LRGSHGELNTLRSKTPKPLSDRLRLANLSLMKKNFYVWAWTVLVSLPAWAHGADKFTTIYSSRVLSQSLPWIAQEAGLFKKYNLDHSLVFIASSSIVTAALLGGDPDMTLTGGIGNVTAYVRGSTEPVFVGGIKNTMTNSLLAGGNIKRPEDIRGKKIGVSRLGSNSHYFSIQALRRHNMEPGRDYTFLQVGGDPETLAALMSGGIDVGCLAAPTDAQALARGFHYVIYGPDLRIPYASTALVTKRSTIAKRPQTMSNYMRAIAEAAKVLHTDREFVYRVVGKNLRITDQSILEAAYSAEIKALEPRLAIRAESLQAIIDDMAQTDPRAKKIKSQDLADYRFLDDMEKSGFFDQLWAKR
jgi:ABC-type nitrate/sulfonate/bicarbonate transport system substrate-binding protein